MACAIDAPPLQIIKQSVLNLGLNQFAFFFNNNDHIKTIGPFAQRALIKRPCLPHLIRGNTAALGLCLIDIQQRKSMDQIQPVFTRGYKANFGACLP